MDATDAVREALELLESEDDCPLRVLAAADTVRRARAQLRRAAALLGE